MSILLEEDEIFSERIASAFEIVLTKKVRSKKKQKKLLRQAIVKATGKKILIQLQAIYNPDAGIVNLTKLDEFIKQLLKEVE